MAGRDGADQKAAAEFFGASASKENLRSQLADDFWRVRQMARGRTIHGSVILESRSLEASTDPLRVALMEAQYRLMGITLGAERCDAYSPFSPVFRCIRAVQSAGDLKDRSAWVASRPPSFGPDEFRAFTESLDSAHLTWPDLEALMHVTCLPPEINNAHLLVALGLLAVDEAVRALDVGRDASVSGFYLGLAARLAGDAALDVVGRAAGAARQEITANMKAEVLARTGAEGGRKKHRGTNRMKEWARAEAKKIKGSDGHIAAELERLLPMEFNGVSADPYRLFYDDLRLQREKGEAGTTPRAARGSRDG